MYGYRSGSKFALIHLSGPTKPRFAREGDRISSFLLEDHLAIVERIDRLETENRRMRAQLRAQCNLQKGTKKDRAKRLARDEVLRQISHRTDPIGEGGAVDVPTIITMGYAIGVEFTHKTVGDAFRALAAEWNAFELQDGSGKREGASSGKREGANKRLVATNNAIPEALWQVYEADTGETATGEDAITESSEKSNEVH